MSQTHVSQKMRHMSLAHRSQVALMDDSIRYQEHLAQKEAEYDARCRRCGACCGVYENDPCVKLVRDADGRYRCGDYAGRFGLQTTVNGNTFK